ncbi:hypothetical protein DFH09DRAFT_1283405 [Mycena vulgaris]|nr:hypothetical protein DFH09DRAFT_1283405 [Mycena vulgaris]
MPRQPTLTEIRIDNITTCLTAALPLLNDLNDAFGPPFSVKRNKDECIQLTENIHQVLYAIFDLHIRSETAGALPPAIIGDIGHFTGTLHKIYTFVEAQQDGNKIRQLLRQSEMNALLKNCRIGINHAMAVFKVDTGVRMFDTINDMKKKTEDMHTELLELIFTLSDGTDSDISSSVYRVANGLQNSSNSFSMLPSKPKIFHGRESELEEIMTILAQDSPRIAILGGGGMGKTALARAALHHPRTSTKFEHRFFVSAESATTRIELAALIGLHLGLQPGQDLTKPVVQYFHRQSSCLLILDNMETPWEPMQSRGGVEEFLSLLTDIEHLALMITMRGAQRPEKVRWTRPFLLPLKPLSDDAALKTFNDITDDSRDSEDKTQLLRLTENLPLVVDLVAHLVDHEGLSNVLARWATEKTGLLSSGHDRQSNLDASITISLTSPRITPGAKELLSLLSILPDGLSDLELFQSNLPIMDIRGCKAVLLATSLAYIDNKTRLKSLMPIREHIQKFCPPSPVLTQHIRKHFHSLLGLYEEHRKGQLGSILTRITLNLANLQEVLRQGLHADYPDLTDTIQCVTSLNCFYRFTMNSHTNLMDNVPSVFPQPSDPRVEVIFITEALYHPAAAQQLIAQALSHCKQLNDPILESKFYQAVGAHATNSQLDLSQTMQFYKQALALSQSCGDADEHCNSLNSIAHIHWRNGDYSAAMTHTAMARRLANLSGNLYAETRALWIEVLYLFHRGREILGLCGMVRSDLDFRILNGLAEVHLLKSEYAEARSIHSQILEETSFDQCGDSYGEALLNIALIDLTIGEAKNTVQRNLDAARNIFTKLGYSEALVFCDMILADLELRTNNTSSAGLLFQKCLKLRKDTQTASFCLERLADVSRWSVTEHGRFTWPVVYMGHAQQTKEKLALHKALLCLGDMFISNTDENTAHSLFTVALEGFTYMDVHHSRAQCMLRLGDLAQNRGDSLKATDLWNAARPLFERSLQGKDIAQIDIRLAAVRDRHQKTLEHLTLLHTPAEPFQELAV